MVKKQVRVVINKWAPGGIYTARAKCDDCGRLMFVDPEHSVLRYLCAVCKEGA